MEVLALAERDPRRVLDATVHQVLEVLEEAVVVRRNRVGEVLGEVVDAEELERLGGRVDALLARAVNQ
jgi:hypothetical protein